MRGSTLKYKHYYKIENACQSFQQKTKNFHKEFLQLSQDFLDFKSFLERNNCMDQSIITLFTLCGLVKGKRMLVTSYYSAP